MKIVIYLALALTPFIGVSQKNIDALSFRKEKRPAKKLVIDTDIHKTIQDRSSIPENINEWIPKNYSSQRLFCDYSRRCKKLEHENGFTIVNKEKLDAVVTVNRIRNEKHFAFAEFYLKPNDSITFTQIPRGTYSYRTKIGEDWRECRMDGRNYGLFTSNRKTLYKSDSTSVNNTGPYHLVLKQFQFRIYKCNHPIIEIKDSSKEIKRALHLHPIVFNTIYSPK